ncbi:MAG: 16S rRNA (cytidine(1402)-2'-O)-methyltransferase [Alphaproteobacteria bacterium]|nr:16S rRNA (cytidine(1402)-2'-O)-methyltransferase [Alphaproteobacteria bacterium]
MSRPSPPPENAGILRRRRDDSPSLEAGLYVVATPIGNLRDITLRALDVLGGADRILAEDTRVTRKLLNAYGIEARVSTYNDHSSDTDRAEILDALAAGEAIALVSDAGTPLISDPGFKLVRAAVEAGHNVMPVPGASSVLAALSVAGLPSNEFYFAGFPPNKSAARRATFEDLAAMQATLIFFETGPRLADSLADMAAIFGDRGAAVARELTKLFEEVRRDRLPDLAAHYAAAGAPKGEVVVLVAPGETAAPDEAAIDAALRDALQRLSVKDAAEEVSTLLGVSRRDAYARALAIKGGG